MKTLETQIREAAQHAVSNHAFARIMAMKLGVIPGWTSSVEQNAEDYLVSIFMTAIEQHQPKEEQKL